jgi:integrase
MRKKLFIKRPSAHSGKYSLMGPNGVIHDERIDNINHDLSKGVARDELEARMRVVRDSFKPKKLELSFTNMRLVEECHAKKLIRKPDLADPYALKRGLIRGAEAMGLMSIKDATEDQIWEAIKGVTQPGRRYHTIRAINELLRFANRDLRLHNPNPKPEHIRYIEIDAFLKAVPKMDDLVATYLGALFASGCRYGEMPIALPRGAGITIMGQIRRKGDWRVTKNGAKTREALLIPSLKPYAVRLNALGRDAAIGVRLSLYPLIRKQCREHLNVKIHDLRHSYAVYMAKAGFELPHIARWIGDTEQVCKDHYSSFCPSNQEMEAFAARLTSSQS